MTRKELLIAYIKGSFINLVAFLGMSFISATMYFSMSHYGTTTLYRVLGDVIGFPMYMCGAFQVVGTIIVLAILLFSSNDTFLDNLFKE